MDLSNRDVAFLLWSGAGAFVFLAWRPGRAAVRAIAGALRPFLGVVLLYALYYALVVAGARLLGVWNTGLLKDTLAWFVLAGIPLLARFPETYEKPGFYRRALRRLIGVSVAIEFFVGLTAFSFGAELLLLPVIVVFGVLAAFAGTKPEYTRVKSYLDIALGLIGLFILYQTAVRLIELIPIFDLRHLGLMIFLPVWATFFSLLFVFLFGLYANYEPKMREINRTAAGHRRARWRAKLALLSAFGMRNLELGRIAPIHARELAETKSWGEARRYVTHKRAEIRYQRAKDEQKTRQLARFSGVEGTDWEGVPLDQREFPETREALDHLHAFHEAQYADGRYRANLLDMVGGLLSKTFAESEIVMTIHPKGRKWFAWRRTVTGWIIGIGATGAPPDQWVYEGPEPPTGYPDKDEGWRRGGFDKEDGVGS